MLIQLIHKYRSALDSIQRANIFKLAQRYLKDSEFSQFIKAI